MQGSAWHVAAELHKLELILDVLTSGYSVLYMEPDSTVFRNPMLHLLSLQVRSFPCIILNTLRVTTALSSLVFSAFMADFVIRLHTNSCLRGCNLPAVTLMENSDSTRPHRGVSSSAMGTPALRLVTCWSQPACTLNRASGCICLHSAPGRTLLYDYHDCMLPHTALMFFQLTGRHSAPRQPLHCDH